MKALHMAAAAALAALAACTEQSPATPADQPAATPEAASPQGPAAIAADVNWDAAKADLAKRPTDVVVPQSVGDGPLLVPMLLPGGIVQTQSDRPTPPRVTKDGYFATYHLPRYDVIVTGSQKAYAVGGATPDADKEAPKFETVDAGARLNFSRYGASYEIAFECRQVDGPEGCISEAEAKEFAESLFVAQSR
ncbi:MAG: hypothetical protein B7Z38_01320 [Rhodobacterales bacterium 12-64-8]|nr:MAG: hypothetical protein B7Z38_01320 [Rhodobacterales bacterium 12-64-8]OYX46106.1 MAG: hypothetical protein B7Y90_16990 [Alphaproteobacteria bacterium 32-64-14]